MEKFIAAVMQWVINLPNKVIIKSLNDDNVNASKIGRGNKMGLGETKLHAWKNYAKCCCKKNMILYQLFKSFDWRIFHYICISDKRCLMSRCRYCHSEWNAKDSEFIYAMLRKRHLSKTFLVAKHFHNYIWK